MLDDELLDMASMKATTTGENIAKEVSKIVQKFDWILTGPALAGAGPNARPSSDVMMSSL